MPDRTGSVPRLQMLGRSAATTLPSLDEDGHPSAASITNTDFERSALLGATLPSET